MSRGHQRRPNILFLMSDQHRADCLGANGNAVIQTPHLDRLAASGVNFPWSYTESPVCVSARAILMTGILPHRTGVYSNRDVLPGDHPTIMTCLSKAGYFTQAIGKMHFRPVRESHGLQRMWLSEEIPGHIADDEFLQDLIAAGYGHVEEPHGIRHELYLLPQVSQLPEHLHTTAWTGRKTIQFLREHQSERPDQPFFCWTSFQKPHPPFEPPVPWHRLYQPHMAPQPVRSRDELAWLPWVMRNSTFRQLADETPDYNRLAAMWTYYYGAISFIDSWIGMILDELEALDLRGQTLIVYTSDHGEFLGDHWSFGKSSFLDPAARVPLILSWPGHIPEGVVRDQLVGGSDIVPTLLAVAGVDPGVGGLTPDGINLLPVTQDNMPTRDVLIGQVGSGTAAQLGAISREWKYIYSCGENRELLFKYRDGERELRNYAAYGGSAYAAACADLRQVIIERYRRDGATELLAPDGDHFRLFPERLPATVHASDPEVRIKDRMWQYARWIRTLPDGWQPPPPSPAGEIPPDLPRRSHRDRYEWPPLLG